MKLNNETKKYIPLAKAAKTYGCTPEHLNLMSRQGKLQSVKIGRNWFTTSSWLGEYKKFVKKSERYNKKKKNLVSNIRKKRTIYPYKIRNSIKGFFQKTLFISLAFLIVVFSIGTIYVDNNNDSFSIIDSIESIFDFSEVPSIVVNYLEDIKNAYSDVFKLAEDSVESLAFNYVGFIEDSAGRVVKKVERIKIPKIKIVAEKQIKTISYNFETPNFDRLIKDLDINVNNSLVTIKYEENERIVKKPVKKNQTFVGFFLESLIDGFIGVDRSFNTGLEKFGKSADLSFASVVSFSRQAIGLFDLSEELGPVSERFSSLLKIFRDKIKVRVSLKETFSLFDFSEEIGSVSEKFSNILASIGDIHKKIIEIADEQKIIINKETEEIVEEPFSNVIE